MSNGLDSEGGKRKVRIASLRTFLGNVAPSNVVQLDHILATTEARFEDAHGLFVEYFSGDPALLPILVKYLDLRTEIDKFLRERSE